MEIFRIRLQHLFVCSGSSEMSNQYLTFERLKKILRLFVRTNLPTLTGVVRM